MLPFKVELYLVNNFKYLGFSEPMALAMVEALKVNPYPNPRVGALLIDEQGNVKAAANHKQKGSNHAEINIFEQVQVEETDILYVTLEPCFHSDTSPSCATEIINRGVKNIVIGDIDLDIRTNGKSVSLLKDNNISVQIESNANNILNPYYENTHKKLKDIHYLLKIGMSKNDYITNDASDSRYITNEISLSIVHYLRATADCIVIGKNTLLNDEPKLNVRISGINNIDHNPEPIIMWGRSTENIESAMKKYPTFTFLSSMPSRENNTYCDTSSLSDVEEYFLERKFRNIFIEGGKGILGSFLRDHKIDSIYEFKSNLNIENGIHIGHNYRAEIDKNYHMNNKYQLLDNLLTTYTRN